MEGKKAEKPAEEAESKITPPAAAAEELKEAEEKAEAETEATVAGREEEEEYKGAVTEKSAVEVETKATETQVQENSSEGKSV